MDHTLLDVMILNVRQQAVRPRFTIVLDDCSRHDRQLRRWHLRAHCREFRDGVAVGRRIETKPEVGGVGTSRRSLRRSRVGLDFDQD